MRKEFLCICVLSVASGPRVKLAGRKSALNPGGLFQGPFQSGSPGVGLIICCFVIYSTRRFVFSSPELCLRSTISAYNFHCFNYALNFHPIHYNI